MHASLWKVYLQNYHALEKNALNVKNRKRGSLHWRVAEILTFLQEKRMRSKGRVVCFLCTWSNGRYSSLAQSGHIECLHPYWMHLPRDAAGLMLSKGNRPVFRFFVHFQWLLWRRDSCSTSVHAPMATHLLPYLSAQDWGTRYNPRAL